MSISSTTVNVLAGAAALVASTGIFMVSPFTQDLPQAVPAPELPIICQVYIPEDPSEPTQECCSYLNYPASVTRIITTTPF